MDFGVFVGRIIIKNTCFFFHSSAIIVCLEEDANMANDKKSEVFTKLDEMFNSPLSNSWGSATYIRHTIRSLFSLTHAQAKAFHEEWTKCSKTS